MSFYNNWNKGNKWNLRRDSIKKEAHIKNHLWTGGYNTHGEERSRRVCNCESLFPARPWNYPIFTKRDKYPAEKKHLIKPITVKHKASELRSDSCYNDNLGVYMTNFMFIYNALFLGSFDFVSENKITVLWSFSAKDICIFPSLNTPLGYSSAGLWSPAQAEQLTTEKEGCPQSQII